MKVIIHVGQPKTGTTSIQRLLFRNREQLLAQGILYPDARITGVNHSILAAPFRSKVQRALSAKIGTDRTHAREVAQSVWASVAETIRRARPQTVILSSEHFMSLDDFGPLPGYIRDYLGAEVDLCFLAYLRRPSERYASQIQQVLKASHTLPPPDQSGLLRQLDSFAAIAPVRARFFSRDTLHNGDVVEDACREFGVRPETLKRPVRRQNTSLSAESTILLQRYRRQHHGGRNNVFTPDTKAFIAQLVREEKRHPDRYTRMKLHPEIAQFLDRETEEIAGIRRRFGIDLGRDHGVPAISEDKLSDIVDVEQVVDHDSALLTRMARAVSARSRRER